MLYKETISPAILELLNELMTDEHLNNFFLVGGTALSLQLGHRMSIDIDLFSQSSFDEDVLSEYLETNKKFHLQYISRNTIKGTVNNVKVDLIAHIYPLVNGLVSTENIRLASLEDIAAMKLNAIVGNGTRLKDFVDIAFLSLHISLKTMVDAYEKKYSVRNPNMAVKALAFHNDINNLEPIQLLHQPYKWNPIEKRINEMIKYPDKIFLSQPG